MICSSPNTKSRISRKQQGAEKRLCFCLAFDRISFLASNGHGLYSLGYP
jgi:hypothetical protein